MHEHTLEMEGHDLPEAAVKRVRWPQFGKPVFLVVHRRQVYFLAFVLLLALTYAFAAGYSQPVGSLLRDEEPYATVAIDAGHGGPDPGAVGAEGTLEKHITLAIALQLDGILRGAGLTTVLTRTADQDLVGDEEVPHRQRADLIARAEVVNASKADAFVSLHANSFPNPALRGAQTFYFEGDDGGWRLALHIQNALNRALPANNRRAAAADLRILHDVQSPAAVVEVGFLTNPAEELLLNDEEYQRRVAQAVADGIVSYLLEHRRRPLPLAPERPAP